MDKKKKENINYDLELDKLFATVPDVCMKTPDIYSRFFVKLDELNFTDEVLKHMGIFDDDFSWDNISTGDKEYFLQSLRKAAIKEKESEFDSISMYITFTIFWAWYYSTKSNDQAQDLDLILTNMIKSYRNGTLCFSSSYSLGKYTEEMYRDAIRSMFKNDNSYSFEGIKCDSLFKFIKKHKLETYKGFIKFAELYTEDINKFAWKYATKETKRILRKRGSLYYSIY